MKKASDYLVPKRGSKRKRRTFTEEDIKKDRGITAAILEELEQRGVSTVRPEVRSKCPTTRPCPFVGCRYHLFLDIEENGDIKFNFHGLEPWEMPETCSLDVAEKTTEKRSLTSTGNLMGLTRERVRQLESSAFEKLKEARDAEAI